MRATGLLRLPLFSTVLRPGAPLLLAGLAGLLLGAGCGGKSRPTAPPPTTTAAEVAEPVPARSPVVSWDILEREPVANNAEVKHILISWKELSGNFSGQGDPRGAGRTREEAEKEVRAVLALARDGGEFEELMGTYSEDQGSARSGESYKVSPDAGLVIEFKQLGLRLNVGEVGVCQSDFGYHIIKRFL